MKKKIKIGNLCQLKSNWKILESEAHKFAVIINVNVVNKLKYVTVFVQSNTPVIIRILKKKILFYMNDIKFEIGQLCQLNYPININCQYLNVLVVVISTPLKQQYFYRVLPVNKELKSILCYERELTPML